MEKLNERLELFYQEEFFQNYPGLAESIVQFEEIIDKKLPSQFEIDWLPTYHIGDNQVILGKIHTYYVFGLIMTGFANYQLFETKGKMKLYFGDMAKENEGFDKEDFLFWTQQIDLMN